MPIFSFLSISVRMREDAGNGQLIIGLIVAPLTTTPFVSFILFTIGTQILSSSHARVTLFSHIFPELQFHHHLFITVEVKM